MAFRCVKLLRTIGSINAIRHNSLSTTVTIPTNIKTLKPKEFKTEENLVFLEDPDTFGTLSRFSNHKNIPQDEGDEKESDFLENVPLKSQKLTIKQYADIIKQYVKLKRLKEAIDVLEVRMLQVDRVKPENYIYNILIGACADVGYTKKAFKLFNEMKRRGLKPTGDTYTCLFHACSNSPWAADGLKNAKHLRELMIEKGVDPNLTNYNAMIKAFGRCGDLTTAFKIVDEMIAKIKIRVHTFNHLLQACISDKENGLRHALIVWRKMLRSREKPNIYSFNLILKCVKDCQLGNKANIEELIGIIQEQITIDDKKNILQIESVNQDTTAIDTQLLVAKTPPIEIQDDVGLVENKKVVPYNGQHEIQMQIVNRIDKANINERFVPNLLSKTLKMDQVLNLQEVHTLQEKFAIVGGQEDFLEEMNACFVKPDIKTLTQMLPLLEETVEAENKLLETMKKLEINADIDFYNMLIKKRCLRSDYEAAFDVKEIIKKEAKYRESRYRLNKKKRLHVNIMTYGVLAMACKTRSKSEALINEMREEQIKINIQILGTLLRQGTAHVDIDYVLYIMDVVREEKIPLNNIFLKHLEDFNEKCANIIKKQTFQKNSKSGGFEKAYKKYSKAYTKWLKEMDVEKALEPEHPWQQFREESVETVQRQNIKIVEPKKFYKRNRKYVPYAPKL
ncbi:LOW QUALITY PROTEIN: pentatricopeptide repeat-containing protein 1, mitochondrial-like [Manduca sexta]|uniref:LOW QUALITY PROTEIN: pentatricopeptide repeat-containing protein 1, mitochondrial-like n=1 Tax=Manduca sexta TaxID=7130 RepID=UPI00188E68F4|nr:LOW QUALITY PROTEIN: pentatricopeptide repeat-containing protein 1, mitochondrial-like [Manduca sexta]